MRILGAVSRLILDRWPIIFVVPVFVNAGYTWVQVLVFAAVVAALTELAFAVVKLLLLDRE